MRSVCIATFNGERFIRGQLESILCQLDASDEVIISDDHSTDDTLAQISELNDQRIAVVSNPHERGYTSNFENALRRAQGDTVFLADQDDYWLRDKIRSTEDALQFADFVVCNALVSDAELNPTGETVFEGRKVRQGFMSNLFKIRYLGCCMAFRRNVLEKALPFPPDHELSAHDGWLTLIAELYFNVCLIESPLLKYRRHSSNTSLGLQRSTNSYLRRFHIRAYSVWHLIRRAYRQ